MPDDRTLTDRERPRRLRRVARAFGVVSAAPGIVFMLTLPDWISRGSPLAWLAMLVGVPLLMVPLGWSVGGLLLLVTTASGLLSAEDDDRRDATLDLIGGLMPLRAAQDYKAEMTAAGKGCGDRRDVQRQFRRSLWRGAARTIAGSWRRHPALVGLTRLSRWWTIGAPVVAGLLGSFTALLLEFDPAGKLTPVLSLQVSIVAAIVSIVTLIRSRK